MGSIPSNLSRREFRLSHSSPMSSITNMSFLFFCVFNHIHYTIDRTSISDEDNLAHWFYIIEKELLEMHGTVKYLIEVQLIQLPVNSYPKSTQE